MVLWIYMLFQVGQLTQTVHRLAEVAMPTRRTKAGGVFSCSAAAVCLLAFSRTAFAQAANPADPQDVTQLDDVVVVSRDIEQTAQAFVAEVSAHPQGRKPAAWRDRICVGVGGMSAEPARVLADRISDWGHSLGLRIAAPGCTPNIFVVATDNGNATARELVSTRPREFRTGASGSDQGAAALREFQSSDKPVRWWHVSLPVNEDTGSPAVRLPGQAPLSLPTNLTRPADFGWAGVTVPPSRLADHTRDDLQQVIIVLDVAALDHASFNQIADYLSMIALAQVDQDASPQAPSILGLFDLGGVQEATLTRWDQAYLRALYGARLGSSTEGVNRTALARATAREIAKASERQP